jgi:hypothetical protein
MSKKTALNIIFILLGGLLTFHLLIISQIIPYDQVWGGRLQSETEMIQFESFSIALNLFMLLIFGIQYRLLIKGKTNRIIRIMIYLFAAFFFLNTLGNLMAESKLEMILGGFLTAVAGVLCLLIARKP